MRSTQTSHLGRVGEASADAVVVTDSVSVNADYDNGGRARPRLGLRGPNGAWRNAVATRVRAERQQLPHCEASYTTTCPLANSGVGRRSSLRFCTTHSAAFLLLSSALCWSSKTLTETISSSLSLGTRMKYETNPRMSLIRGTKSSCTRRTTSSIEGGSA